MPGRAWKRLASRFRSKVRTSACCWSPPGLAGAVSCSKERAQILENAAHPWRETVIEPLRRLRCAWREAATHDACLAELREEMKAQELRAEREHLQRLADLATAWLEGQEANRSADAWLQACSRDICTEAERRALLVLGSAALQTAP